MNTFVHRHACTQNIHTYHRLCCSGCVKIGAALGQSTIGERIVYEISAKEGSHNTNDSIKEFSQNRGIFFKDSGKYKATMERHFFVCGML